MTRPADTKFARELRRRQTDCERKLWGRLRARQVAGFKFRRQHPIGPYFVDFVCVEKGLVVELDGGQHAEARAYEGRRTEFLQSQGYRVLRFWDNEVLLEMDGVLERIHQNVNHPHPSPLPQAGEGGNEGLKKQCRFPCGRGERGEK